VRLVIGIVLLLTLGAIVRRALDPFLLSLEPPDLWIANPLRPPARVVDTWDAPRGAGRRHQGIDLFAAHGDPVYSVARGYVTRIGDAGIGGNAIWVLGAGRRVYYYAHLSAFAEGLKVGQEVLPGQVLGYVGNTGNALNTPPHLHLGIYAPGGAINPFPLLTGRPEAPDASD
jgi:murein DD-endopeptidase MepM/ murein hydrolase activator NlpD